ncbi:MAG: NAD(P)/FAD-dependent oxidoreductase [Rhodococcus sp.]|uniref:NAD(P)/FAD-dependent oxidoreductase n=1 Tax=Rhodococcus sp. TaxID=1831 RepID=UPI00169F2A0D|nr:NAD(P)/FAD-dependent oxidoreductase [Rhodococcus sp. (in: high G+C Gram-positive bacteria)]NLV80239.1 NAD(P)/FAD-dependent oxidoreductase [Rhodococcus sp. (in: high G+C Gram-positive bacteria)]
MTATDKGEADFVDRTEVVIVGSGFGALAAAKKLGKAGKPFVLISETTEHLFQPLLYQVATGVISPGEIAPSVRAILAKYPNADVRLGRVVDVNPDDNTVVYESHGQRHTLGYEQLIAATGARQAYFGRDEFADVTYALKTVDDADRLRRQIVRCFEEAHTTTDAERRKNLLSFIVVGAGPTGVELAGQIKELAKRYFGESVHNVDPADVTVTLVEGADKVLPPFGGKLSEYSKDSLEKAGVDVVLNTLVTDIDESGATLKTAGSDETRRLTAETIIWSAGIQANDFAGVLAERTGCETVRGGRLLVDDDFTVGSADNIYAIGDMVTLNNLPAQSPFAMQGGRHVAKMILGKIPAGTPFKYRDKGSMAIINRFSAITRVGRIQLTGFIAWVLWLAVHLVYLVGFRNRYIAVMSWCGSFLGRRRPHFYYAQETPRPADEKPRPAQPATAASAGTKPSANNGSKSPTKKNRGANRKKVPVPVS